jgi:hypothetical protein
MSTALATTQQTSLPAAPKKQQRALTPTGKLREALDLMVFGPTTGENAGMAMSLAEACRAVNLHYASMRKALEKPHVRTYLNRQKEVFRASASAQNISALVKLRDGDNAMAALGAIKTLEQIGTDTQASAQRVQSPGIVILVGSAPTPPTLDIHVNSERT